MRNPYAEQERPGGECPECAEPARLRECDDCGRRAWLIDCGHYGQPRPIAAGRRGGRQADRDYCEDCAAVSPAEAGDAQRERE